CTREPFITMVVAKYFDVW
nr:immunoglobulin heavy chain junction region [Mus musculus]